MNINIFSPETVKNAIKYSLRARLISVIGTTILIPLIIMVITYLLNFSYMFFINEKVIINDFTATFIAGILAFGVSLFALFFKVSFFNPFWIIRNPTFGEVRRYLEKLKKN